jgi:purine-nucleoside/S-methyl-5'-thioadenosine phosphorylase / adenosine deaminase
VSVHGSPRTNTTILQSDLLQEIPWLLHGFSTRAGGLTTVYGGHDLNLGFTKQDSHSAVQRNREIFLQQLGAAQNGRLWPLIMLRQIHSDLIHSIDRAPQEHLAGDGLITCRAGMLLGIVTADCLPVILVDTNRRAVGIFHAGWRGTVKRILEKGVGEMQRRFATCPSDLKAAIGPGIHKCCYEVGADVREQFTSQFNYASELFHELTESNPVRDKYPLLFLSARPPGRTPMPKKVFLDLPEANRRQLLVAGVPSKNISVSPVCTSCRTDLLFSYRTEKGLTGRMMGAIGIRPA